MFVMQTSAMKTCFQIAECNFSYAKKMQTSAMKTCFQIAECSFSYAKLSNISVTSKYLNEINIIIGQIILNPPSCFLKRDEGFFFSILPRTSLLPLHLETSLNELVNGC